MDGTEQTVGGVSLAKLTKAYIRIRDRRSKLKSDFDAADSELREKQDSIKRALLDYCKESGAESVRTAEGLFYRTMRKRYWTNDWESMHRFIMENAVPEFFEKRLNQGVVAQFLEEHPDTVPPGLNVDAEYNIAVRKK